jgi:hypothetical protein
MTGRRERTPRREVVLKKNMRGERQSWLIEGDKIYRRQEEKR